MCEVLLVIKRCLFLLLVLELAAKTVQAPLHQSERDSEKTIAIFEEKDGKLEFNNNNLHKLLDPVKSTPLAVVSIAGAKRTGKSFLLNLLLRYLKQEGWKNGDWLQNWTSSENAGIDWRGGSEAHTRGIVAWGKPIFVTKSDGQKIAIVLLDTQGNFEYGRSMKENIKIFALSTLFSSLQIFNVNKQMQTNDFDYLQCFVEFTKMLMPLPRESNAVHGNPFFQGLTYLVRDWPYPADFDYGKEGGMKYLNKFMSIGNGTGNQREVQKYLKITFQNLNCFLMPEPGQNVRISRNGNRILKNEDLGADFSLHLHAFANNHLHPDRVAMKNFGHVENGTADDLIKFMKMCAAALNKDSDLPDDLNLMNLYAEHANIMAMEKARESFIRNLNESMDQMEKVHWEVFLSLAQSAEHAALEEFRYNSRYGKEYMEERIGLLNDLLKSDKEKLITRMRVMRKEYAKNETRKWLDECTKKIKDHCGYFYTSLQGLRKIEQSCLHRSLKAHELDGDGVTRILDTAKMKFLNWTKDAIAKETANRKRICYGLTAGAVAVFCAAGPFAALACLFGAGATTAGLSTYYCDF